MDGTTRSHAKPLLFRGAVPRISHPEIPGRYDPDQQVWVLETRAGLAPIISASCPTMREVETKTRVRQEADDEAGIADLVTKTAVQQESDDEVWPAGLADMATKTFVVEESDDEAQFRSMLELETKTEAEAEHDDESRPII